MSGAVSHHAGLSAEDRVSRRYEQAGCAVRARRWRGRAGEIDIVVQDGAVLVFVEVKAAATHARAAERFGARQAARVMAAAEDYVACEPAGSLSKMRFDVALVDGHGRIEILANALVA